jgi:hypothetical protein
MLVKKIGLLAGILAFGAFNVLAAGNDEHFNLKCRLETGMRFGYRLTVKTATTQNVLEKVVPREEEWQIKYRVTVLSGSGNRGGIVLRATYAAIDYRLDSPWQQYAGHLSPDDVTLPERLKPYANLVGTDFKVSLSKTPRIEIPAKRHNPVNPEDFDLQLFLSSINPDTLAAQTLFANLLGNILFTYPHSPAKLRLNDRWQGVSCLTNGSFTPKLRCKYQVTAIDAERIKLAVTTPFGCKYRNRQPVKNHQTEVMKVVTDLTGSLQGRIEIVKKSKLPAAGMLRLDLAGTVNRFGTLVPVTLTMTVQYRLI